MSRESQIITVASIGISYGHDRVANTLLEDFENTGLSAKYVDISKTGNKAERLVWDFKEKVFKFVSTHQHISQAYTKLTDPKIFLRRNYPGLSSTRLSDEAEGSICIATHYSSAFEMSRKMPTVSYITDFMSRPAHVNRLVFTYAVPTEQVGYQLGKNGADMKKVVVTGVILPETLTKRATNGYKERLTKLNRECQKAILIAIGGGGAHTDLVIRLLTIAKESRWLETNSIVVFVGNNKKIKDDLSAKFTGNVMGDNKIRSGINIIYNENKWESFKLADEVIPRIDVIISKPDIWMSYALLGIPFFALPPVGYQEVVNLEFGLCKKFLRHSTDTEIARLFKSNDISYLIPNSECAFSPDMINGLKNVKRILKNLG